MENIRNNPKGDKNKIWKILLSLAATVFLAIATAMIIVDQRYCLGILYLITSALYFSSAYLIATGRANIMDSSSNEQVSLAFGFTILAIGLALTGVFWGLGFVLFLAAIFSIYKNTI